MVWNRKTPGNLKDQRMLWQPLSVWIILLLGASILVAACGKKADPFIAKKKISASVTSITARYEKGIIKLDGELLWAGWRQDKDREKPKIRVDYGHYGPRNAPCATCPVDFTNHRIVSAIPTKDGRFVARLEVPEQEGVYLLRVRVVGEDGGLGPPSETGRVKIQ